MDLIVELARAAMGAFALGCCVVAFQSQRTSLDTVKELRRLRASLIRMERRKRTVPPPQPGGGTNKNSNDSEFRYENASGAPIIDRAATTEPG